MHDHFISEGNPPPPVLDHVSVPKKRRMRVGFFDISAASRETVYSYIADDFIIADDSTSSTLTVSTDREDLQSQVQSTWSRLADMLLVSKQFGREFKSIWLSEFTFEFSYSEVPPHGDFDPARRDVLNFYHVLEFLEAFTEDERSHIEHIKVTHEIERTVTYTSEQVEWALNHALGDVWPEECIVELEIKRMRAAPFNDVRSFTCSRGEDNRIQIQVRDAKWDFVSDEVVGYWDPGSEARMRMEETTRRQS